MTEVAVELIDSDAGRRRPERSDSPTLQVTVTATDPPGSNWAVLVLTVRWPQVTPSEPSAARGGLLGHGRGGRGVAGDGRGACGLGGGAVDVEPGAGEAAEGDDEEQHQDEQRGEQHQFGGHAARLASGPLSEPAQEAVPDHGAAPASV